MSDDQIGAGSGGVSGRDATLRRPVRVWGSRFAAFAPNSKKFKFFEMSGFKILRKE
jgi:hypothetical protein